MMQIRNIRQQSYHNNNNYDLLQRLLLEYLYTFVLHNGIVVVVVVTLCILLNTITTTMALPHGFIDEDVASIPNAISGIFIPNLKRSTVSTTNTMMMLVIVSLDGRIYIIDDIENNASSSTTRPKQQQLGLVGRICNNGSRGVLSIVAHPEFSSRNPYVYIYYSHYVLNCPLHPIFGPSYRLSRFTINTDTLLLNISSEVVLLETPPSSSAVHDGGALVIGTDHYIYLAIGDCNRKEESQNLRTLTGKLIRLRLNGSIPDSNPYAQHMKRGGVNCRNNKGRLPINAPRNAVCEEIYAIGFRNPFRLGIDRDNSNTTNVRFAIADVGNAVWEEVSYGGTESINKNYGWMQYEGPCTLNSNMNCPNPINTSFVEPFYYYEQRMGGAAITGAVYIPNGIWPDQYQFMIVDYVEGLIVNLIQNPKIGCRTCKPPKPSYTNETFHQYDRIVDIFFGPYGNTQAMYYISRKYAVGSPNIRRIRYVGNTNRPPVAIIYVSKNVFLPNETITLNGSNSYDPDDDTITYIWKFGDGRTSTVTSPIIRYTKIGSYTIELIVIDTTGQRSSTQYTIMVGIIPTAIIDYPRDGTKYNVGSTIVLRGRGIENITPPNVSVSFVLPSQQLLWEVNIIHGTHSHPYLPSQVGNNIVLYGPAPEDFMAATNSYLEILLTVFDRNGLANRRRRLIYPNKVNITIHSTTPGMKVKVSDFIITTPSTITTWYNQTIQLSAMDQGIYKFQSWKFQTSTNDMIQRQVQRTINYIVRSSMNNNNNMIIMAEYDTCHNTGNAAVVWTLYNALTDTPIRTIQNGTIIRSNPIQQQQQIPCNHLNIELTFPCNENLVSTGSSSVVIALYNSTNRLLRSRVIRTNTEDDRYFLLENVDKNMISSDDITLLSSGLYRIRTIYSGTISPVTTFTLILDEHC